jgi:hypothetical protein
MKLIELILNRTDHDSLTKQIPPWEVPVMQVVFGAEKTQILRELEDERPYPAADAEYDRLVRRYGVDREDTGSEFVALVYGIAPLGAQRLATAINQVAAGKEMSVDAAPAVGDAAVRLAEAEVRLAEARAREAEARAREAEAQAKIARSPAASAVDPFADLPEATPIEA